MLPALRSPAPWTARRPTARLALWLALGLAAGLGPALAQQTSDAVAPEAAARGAASGLSDAAAAARAAKDEGRPVEAKGWMIAAAHPLAVEAGAAILARGGSASDAMVAVQTVLGLVEPQSSGLGGGAFLVRHDGATGEITTLDGRETAPRDASPTLFQTEAGEPLGFWDAVIGGRSVGTPGTPRLMQAAHDRWGRLPWADLLAPAIELAEEGFEVSPRLAELVAGEPDDRLRRHAPAEAYFFPDGAPLAAGSALRNPAYAETLRAMAEGGADAFYSGPVAEDLVAAVQAADGRLTLEDLAAYRVIERPAVCAPYRGHEVCGMGPPSSGALTVGQILGMLEGFDLAAMGPDDPQAWTLIGGASRLAFADRGRYMADIDYVPMPLKGLLDPDYLAARAALLDPARALEAAEPGEPPWDHALLMGDDAAPELPSTSHISIVDGFGNAIAMTTTIENGFGSRLFVRGFLLNNELTDFSFRSHDEGRPVANRVEPGKRPRSSMAPTIVRRGGTPVLVVGSPGGSRIIGYVAQAVIGMLDWGLDPQQAAGAPHLLDRFGTFDVEAGTSAETLKPALEAAGHEVSARDLTSGLHIIEIREGLLRGGADPRREGLAIGG